MVDGSSKRGRSLPHDGELGGAPATPDAAAAPRGSTSAAAALDDWAVPGITRPGTPEGEAAPARITSAQAMAAHPVISRCVAELREIASSPGDLDAAALNELLLGLVGLRDVVEAVTAPVALAWKDRRDWEADGSRSAHHALARDTHHSTPTCSALFRRARKLHSGTMDGTRKAWETGTLSSETVELLIRAASGKRADLFARDEAELLARIDGKLHIDVVKEIRYWCDRADAEVNPDGTPPPRARHLHASATFGGAVAIDGVLDPVGGSIVLTALQGIDDELKLADKHAAKEAAANGDPTFELRTSSERLADALVELALRATKAPEDGKRPTIALKVAVGSEHLAHLCETFSGVVVRPSDLTDYLDDSTIQFIRFGQDGQPDAATRTTSFARFFTGAMRTAIQQRDRRCQHPSGCDAPIDRCDLDHRVPFAQGGETTVENANLYCVPHNRHHHLRFPRRTTGPEPPPPEPQPPEPQPSGSQPGLAGCR